MRTSWVRSRGLIQIDEPPLVDRLRAKIADPHAQKPDPVLVGIEAGERLGERLADPIAAVWPRHDAVVDRLGARIKADRVVARRHDDALDAGLPGGFEHIVEADNIRLQDHRPLGLTGIAAEMDDPVDPIDHPLDRRHVGDFGQVDFFALARRRQRDSVRQPQHRINTTQSLAQCSPDPAGRPRLSAPDASLAPHSASLP